MRRPGPRILAFLGTVRSSAGHRFHIYRIAGTRKKVLVRRLRADATEMKGVLCPISALA